MSAALFPQLIRTELRITRLKVTDLKFELAIFRRLRQDGSGEKGIETIGQDFVFHVERERPRSFPLK